MTSARAMMNYVLTLAKGLGLFVILTTSATGASLFLLSTQIVEIDVVLYYKEIMIMQIIAGAAGTVLLLVAFRMLKFKRTVSILPVELGLPLVAMILIWVITVPTIIHFVFKNNVWKAYI